MLKSVAPRSVTPKSRAGSRLADIGWFLLTVLASLWVYLANGQPLFYDDSAAYMNAGVGLLEKVGLGVDTSGNLVSSAQGGEAIPAQQAESGVNVVKGNRSLGYSLLLAFFDFIASPVAEIYFQALVLITTIHLSILAALRATGATTSAWQVTALTMAAATIGSGAFYVAYLMPDIFAPVLILSIATLAILGPHLKIWEGLVLFIFAVGSVLTHPSHLVIVILMVPLAIFVALFSRSQRWWVAGLLVAGIAFIGIAERVTFRIAIEDFTTDNKVVYYTPFMTARLIVDGPGKRYLEENCPDDNIATCELNQILNDPAQFTASGIIFSRTPETGSFRLLSQDTQLRIAEEQTRFLLDVALDRPFELAFALVKNTTIQLGLISVGQTIPKAGTLFRALRIYPDFPSVYAEGRLTGSRGWITIVTGFQGLLYVVSAFVLIGLIVLPKSRVSAPLRTFAVLIILGILVNAFVMGAISQPAIRYGSRVIFLIPATLMILLLTRIRLPGAGKYKPGAP